jgi:tRNA1Val (adenine37-N6)-methyltransferase
VAHAQALALLKLPLRNNQQKYLRRTEQTVTSVCSVYSIFEVIMDIKLLDDERLDKINEKLTLIQKKQGLTFGSDTFLLSAFIKEQKHARAADLGSGTGVAALLCATKGKFKKIYAIEIQKSFCELIERNVELNGLSDVISTVEKDVRDASPTDTDGELDAVFSNPRYMKVGSGKRNAAD